MNPKVLSLFFGTTLLAGSAMTAQADVHVGIGIGVVAPAVVAPPVYYVPAPPVYYAPPPPPVYYGPGIVIGVGGGHDWRDHRGHDAGRGHDQWRVPSAL
jgi:hypothetical protein